MQSSKNQRTKPTSGPKAHEYEKFNALSPEIRNKFARIPCRIISNIVQSLIINKSIKSVNKAATFFIVALAVMSLLKKVPFSASFYVVGSGDKYTQIGL